MQLLKQEKLDFVRKGIALAPFTTYGIGGEAEYLAIVHTKQQLQEAVSFCCQEALPYYILGRGSNVLFDDRGYKGMVIVNRIDFLEQKKHIFRVGAGYSFVRLGQLSAKMGYGGLEFASGIPGSVGGAIYMNAGAQGAETKDTLEEVVCFSEGKEVLLKKEEMQFGYRFSNFQQEKQIILEATFHLTPATDAKEKQKILLAKRMATQPYSDKSCGCIFQNPLPLFAGKLIEEANLKGLQVGGAAISHTHANFIVNAGGATARDVLETIRMIKQIVYEKTGVMLQEEVRFVAYE